MPDTTSHDSAGSWLQRPDRRDKYLAEKGVLSLFIGYAYTVAPVPRATRTQLSTVTDAVPLWVYGLCWIAAGLYCIAAAYVPRMVGGFRVAVIMPTVWGFTYAFCWLNGDPGRGWVLAGIFWEIARATYRASGLIDPMPVVGRPRR